MQCSPNPCFDPTAPGNQQTTTQNDAMLQNDGPKDAAGNCLGQLYIFNGKPSRCRPPGLRVGMINNCCDSDETVSEDLGTSIGVLDGKGASSIPKVTPLTRWIT